ncbi:MAG: glycosyltransferase family 9 protein [Flavobacteriaceae bacterium]|nr:glycosyltransferase family 9 protein [Flavobacteriaceae bacterium]
MGDVAMTVPVLLKLTKTYPEVAVTVISRKLFQPIFKDIPNVSFLEADVKGKHKGLLGIVSLAKEAKRKNITAVADLHNVIRSNVMTRYFKSFAIKVAKIDKGRAEKKEITKPNGKPLTPLKSTHERYADVFRKLGYALDLKPPLFLNKKPLPQQFTIDASKKKIGIAPFAAYNSKMYPLELMKEVLQKLDEKGTYQLFLFGSKDEKEALSQLASGLKSTTIVASLVSFEEELALISNLDAMLSMDSANGHLAAMYGIPVITLWGVTHPFIGFMPYNQPMENQLISDLEKYPLLPTSVYGNKFPKGYEKVMESIKPSSVIEKISSILETSPFEKG